MQCRVSCHQCDAARIRAKIHGTEVGVTGKQPNVERVNAQNFGDNSGENIIRTLSDFRCTAKNADASAAIEFQLNSRMWHFVPVNGKPRASQIGGASQTYAAARWEFVEFLFPIGDFDDAANALSEIDGAEAEEICGNGV